MKRHCIPPRIDWKTKVETLGFGYHTPDNALYWDESHYYEFSYQQIKILEDASDKLHHLCLKAVDYIIRENLFEQFCIPEPFIKHIRTSWQHESPSIYGRFDLSWDGDLNKAPKLFEYNADTPTSLFEAGVVQWFWLKDFHAGWDQFNSIHEKLIYWWKQIRPQLRKQTLYFSCLDEFPEDFINMSYLQDCAMQAGIETKFIAIGDIGWDGKDFRDTEEQKIPCIFKLYPWEWIMHEEFAPHLLKTDTQWIEPSWKMILSNKAILPVLWKLNPGHPNLLECYLNSPGGMHDYIRKPILSREGANVSLVENNHLIAETGGEYGSEGFVYQQLYKLPDFDGNHPVIGSWIIGGKSAGIGIRESKSLITDNFSRFVPHAITT